MIGRRSRESETCLRWATTAAWRSCYEEIEGYGHCKQQWILLQLFVIKSREMAGITSEEEMKPNPRKRLD